MNCCDVSLYYGIWVVVYAAARSQWKITFSMGKGQSLPLSHRQNNSFRFLNNATSNLHPMMAWCRPQFVWMCKVLKETFSPLCCMSFAWYRRVGKNYWWIFSDKHSGCLCLWKYSYGNKGIIRCWCQNVNGMSFGPWSDYSSIACKMVVRCFKVI